MTYRAEDWKPGDVAIAAYPVWGGDAQVTYAETRIARFKDGWARLDDPDDFVLDVSPRRPADPRRLVVIDPVAITGPDETGEDGDPLAEIAKCLRRLAEEDHPSTYRRRVAERLAEAFDPPPPKPDEPKGLGAVVEAICCDDEPSVLIHDPLSVRFEGRPLAANRTWKSTCGHHSWDALSAVRVLSEGVVPS